MEHWLAEVDTQLADLPESPVHVEALVLRSGFSLVRGDYERAVAAASEALPHVQWLDRPDLHARALDVIGSSRAGQGELEALADQRRAIEIAREGRAIWELHHAINTRRSRTSSSASSIRRTSSTRSGGRSSRPSVRPATTATGSRLPARGRTTGKGAGTTLSSGSAASSRVFPQAGRTISRRTPCRCAPRSSWAATAGRMRAPTWLAASRWPRASAIRRRWPRFAAFAPGCSSWRAAPPRRRPTSIR
jgi:hypothetical protein